MLGQSAFLVFLNSMETEFAFVAELPKVPLVAFEKTEFELR
ncbi:hypothetical protein RCH16_003664 [Cryobacterium sp. MP_M5]|nr:hypothetical protein [Cryobacterium sp. MP_M3]MEC5178624.1 hypothetical protein [Cryobacterium sp. MP_M5]